MADAGGGRTAVITGGTRGLGRALVRGFAASGYRVYTTARDASALDEVRAASQDAGLDVQTVQGDVTSIEDNARLAGRLSEDGRRVHVVVHNAGLLGAARTPLASYPPEQFRQVMDVNVFGPFDLTRQLVPLLAEHAAILFVSSGASLAPRAGWGAYAVSKMALEGLAGIFALELKERGVRVHAVDPGAMRTSMRAAAYPREDPATLDEPEARVAAFLRLADPAAHVESGARVRA